jgi:DNA adenine methylase
MISVYPWLGGKHRYIKTFQTIIQNLQFNRYIEPFFGSGAVFFSLEILNKPCILSDRNLHIVDFWTYAQNVQNPQEIIDGLVQRQSVNSPDTFKQVIKQYNTSHNPLDFLYITRNSFGGFLKQQKNARMISAAINPCCKTKLVVSPKNLNETLKTLKYVNHNPFLKFELSDYSDIIAKCQVGDIVYLDPPYFIDTDKFVNNYSSGDTMRSQEAQLKLFNDIETLTKKNVRWITTNANHLLIRDSFLRLVASLLSQIDSQSSPQCRLECVL